VETPSAGIIVWSCCRNHYHGRRLGGLRTSHSQAQIEELADKRQIASLKAGLEIPAKDYLKAMRIRSLISRI
jgi:hypothetical protein